MNIGPTMAGFLGPGRTTLGAHLSGVFGGVIETAGRPDVLHGKYTSNPKGQRS